MKLALESWATGMIAMLYVICKFRSFPLPSTYCDFILETTELMIRSISTELLQRQRGPFT